jgi:hypothetical protein
VTTSPTPQSMDGHTVRDANRMLTQLPRSWTRAIATGTLRPGKGVPTSLWLRRLTSLAQRKQGAKTIVSGVISSTEEE